MMNSFGMKKDRLPDYLLSNYFVWQFVNNFPALLLCRMNVLDIFYMGECFRFLLYVYSEVHDRIKYMIWSNQTFGCECTCHTYLTFDKIRYLIFPQNILKNRLIFSSFDKAPPPPPPKLVDFGNVLKRITILHKTLSSKEFFSPEIPKTSSYCVPLKLQISNYRKCV